MNSISRQLLRMPWGNVLLRPQFHTTSKCLSQDLVGDSFYTSEHRALQETVTKIIEKEVNPFVNEWEAKGEFPAHEVFKKFGQAGLLGINKPTEYGGQGLDYTYEVAFLEMLGKIQCGGIPMAISVQTDMATPALARFGSEALKKQFLEPSIAGDLVAAIGVSEPGAGSDVAAIATKAVKKGDDYIINGSKMWITNAVQADWICLLVNTSEGSIHQNKSLICVPMKTPGVHVAKKLDKLGMRCSDTGLIYFEDVRVPQSNLIGEEGSGFMYQMLQFQEERLAAVVVGTQSMMRALQRTIDYCRDRKTFGQPVLYNQYVHFKFAELATDLEAHRALIYQTTKLYMEGNDVTKWASMCKLNAGRLSRRLIDTCLQYWGGMGYTNEVDISRGFRDGRLMSIAGGSDEVMLMIICKYMNMLPTGGKKKSA